MKPLTSIIQAIGLSSIRWRSIQWKSNWRILSRSRIAFALPWPVLSATPNALSMAVSFRCGVWLLSSRKLTQPITRTTAQAHTSGLPLVSGEGRFRASAAASFRQSIWYSCGEMGLAERIGQAHDGVVGGLGGFGDRGFTFLLAGHRRSSFLGHLILGGTGPAGRVPPLVEYQKAGQKNGGRPQGGADENRIRCPGSPRRCGRPGRRRGTAPGVQDHDEAEGRRRGGPGREGQDGVLGEKPVRDQPGGHRADRTRSGRRPWCCGCT